MVASLREAVLAKLVDARAVLEKLGPQVEAGSSARDWHRGYVKALEEVLDLQGLTLRRYPRWQTDIRTKIARMVPKKGAYGQIADLSVGGCRLITPMELSVGAVIGLAFRLPERSTIVTLHGLVCRTQRVDEEYMVAVEFIGLPESIAEMLGISASVAPVADGGTSWIGTT